MKHITLCENPFEPESWTRHEAEDVCAFLAEKFAVFPPTAKIYHEQVNAEHDVTPASEAAIEHLQTLPGPFFVVVFPEEGAEIPLIIALVVALIAVAVTVSNLPKPTAQANQNLPSPNNDLASRQNSARPFQRIPDIYGTVRSTPDLIMLPYSEYHNNIEYEHAYMCIGRGQFNVFDARDDTTPIANIDGAVVTVFGPHDSPNRLFQAWVPALTPYPGYAQFGTLDPLVPEFIYDAARATSVNGQDLLTDSETESIGSVSTMVFTMDPDPATDATITFTGGEDLSDVVAGQIVYLYVKSYKTHHTTHDTYLSGNYVVRSSTSTTVVLENVQSVANDWGWLQDWPSEFHVTECHMVTQAHLQVGPFLLPHENQTRVWLNIVALNGLYQLDGSGNSTAVTAGLRATIQPCDVSGNPTGDPYNLDMSMVGDAKKNTVAITWKIELNDPGPCFVTLIRTTASPVSAQVSDSIKWRDLLSMTPQPVTDYGNITTVYSITKATSGALSVKERKLNLLVQRLLPVRTGPTAFTGLAGSNSVADILCAAALDPYIGNRDVTELDVAGIYSTADEIGAYFGTDRAQEFCGTFDSNNMSFEDIVATIAQACFCVAYRQGRFLRLAFEKATEDSTLLFGHRNKVPGSEQRTVSFGPSNDFDAVQLDYVSPVDDAVVSLYVPGQGVNMKKITATGVRNYAQAYFLAWRYWNRLKYQNTSTAFTSLAEGGLLLLNDRILVADNTRSGTQDGDVLSQNVLELQLSQPVVFESGKSYHIILQGIDGETESIQVHPGSNDRHVLLGSAPTVTLSLDEDASVHALYWIVPDDDVRPQAFLVTKREPGDNSTTHKITAINYDSRYYLNDGDVLNDTIAADPVDGHKTIIPVRGCGVITM